MTNRAPAQHCNEVEEPDGHEQREPHVATILATFTRVAIASSGLELPAELLSRLDRAGERLPYGLALEVWQHIDEHHDDTAFGVRFAEGVRPRDLGVVGYLAASSETVAAAISRTVRYHALVKDPSELRAGWAAGELGLREMPPPGFRWPAALAEAVLGTYVTLARRLSGRAIIPRRASFVHHRAEVTPAHREMFGPALELGAPSNELVFCEADAHAPLASRDETLAELLEPVAREQLHALRQSDPLLAAVTSTIAAALPDGHPSISTTARRVAMSPRSLQRRLRERELRYQELVDEVRRRRALSLLEDPERTVDEVAFLVGFADASGFRRAFRRWTGAAPRESRANPRMTEGARRSV